MGLFPDKLTFNWIIEPHPMHDTSYLISCIIVARRQLITQSVKKSRAAVHFPVKACLCLGRGTTGGRLAGLTPSPWGVVVLRFQWVPAFLCLAGWPPGPERFGIPTALPGPGIPRHPGRADRRSDPGRRNSWPG